jgi:hypothetical protein
VGTVVKTGEADDPIGVMTVLGLQRYKGKAFLGELRDFLLEKCESKELQQKLEQVGGGGFGALSATSGALLPLLLLLLLRNACSWSR